MTRLATWISQELEPRDAEDFLARVAERLLLEGVPIERAAALVRTPHPTLMGLTFIWTRSSGVVVDTAPEEARTHSRFLTSPIYRVFEEGITIRRRLQDGEGTDEYPFLGELQNRGATDYLAYPITFIGGEHHVLTWTCFTPGGFDDRHIEMLLSVQRPFARLTQIFALQRTAESLLNAYVGPNTGQEILRGRHHLGDSTRIEAVVCFCDLRGSVRLTEHYGMDRYLSELNRFYSATATPVEAASGEVLEFIGDAFLAIFPIERFGDAREACGAALEAVGKAIATLEADNHERRLAGQPEFTCGIGLHIGSVLYGNIGTRDRLSFTVIGRTANEAARIQAKCRDLDQVLLVSEAFSTTLPIEWQDQGAHSLKNISQPMRLFSPAGSYPLSKD